MNTKRLLEILVKVRELYPEDTEVKIEPVIYNEDVSHGTVTGVKLLPDYIVLEVMCLGE